MAFECNLDKENFQKIAARIIPDNKNLKKIIPHLCGSIKHSGRYYHAYTMSVDLELDSGYRHNELNRVNNLVAEFEKVILEDIRNISYKLARNGYKQIDYYYSDEYIDDAIICNNYEFTTNGKRSIVV